MTTNEGVEPADALQSLVTQLTAIASPQRMRVVAELVNQPLHVSELARRVQMSRALLYMHLRKLEDAGFVRGALEIGADGKAVNIYSAQDFTIHLTPAVIADKIASANENKE